MDKFIIENAQYTSNFKASDTKHTETFNTIKCVIDGVQRQVPTDPNNRHYAEILKQVEEGKLTIKDADE